MIYSNSNLSDLERFYYPKSCLKGETRQTLRDRFENKKLIIHSHDRNIFELTPIKQETGSSLRKSINLIRIWDY